ncbi:hypothetical protein [Paraliomyxa miuraensis]|uniref:hypothetical protein n=1 Tax=Paraliomyxa miuraensis TaxID=376150 RepID=UPI002257124A|nr:hypothetical protein [Paraliomyxa miuraensis]MCX4241017.1 hypothetical protein [Paraliomyxa miuraensis]
MTDKDEPLVLGVTFGELMTVVVGERSGPLQWEASESYVRGFPPSGETRITVTVYEPSMVQEIDLERAESSRFPWLNERIDCSDWVEADLEIDLRSDDGALDTTLMTGAKFITSTSASIYADLTEEDLGDLIFDPVDPDATLRLQLSYGTADGPLGALVLRSGSSDGEGNGVGMSVELATWTLE